MTAPNGTGQSIPERLDRLLEAVQAVGSDLDLPVVLRHIVGAAVTLVEAGYGALGVVDASGDGLSAFITVGLDDAGQAGIGAPPTGRGVLGELLRDPRPLRLHELASHPASSGFPANHPPMQTFVGVPVRVGQAVFGNLYLTDKLGGGDFTDADEEVLLTLAVAAGVAIQNARLYEQARRAGACREAGRAISTSLLSGTEREDVVELVVATSREVLGADGAYVALTVAGSLALVAQDGPDAPGLLDQLDPVLATGRHIEVALGGRSGWAVPLGPAGRACPGALVALWGQPVDPAAVEDLLVFAAQAAVAFELADRRLEAERVALLADRDRIGRDLHDLVIQRLFATGMRLQGAIRLIGQDPAEATVRVDLAIDELDDTIRELRSTIYGLQAPEHSRPSLRARVLEVLDAATEQLGFAPTLRLDGLVDTAVPSEVADHVLATLREALSNVARHARATRADVSVSVRGGRLSVAVEDDGVGPPGSGPRSGLRNLTHRAEELGGSLRLGARPLGGTHLQWEVPV